MTDTSAIIKFEAVISRVTTLADNGLRLTLDLPETAVAAATQLLRLKQQDPIVLVAIIPAGEPALPKNQTATHTGWRTTRPPTGLEESHEE